MENILCRNKNQQFLVERENLELITMKINDVVKKEKMKAALTKSIEVIHVHTKV